MGQLGLTHCNESVENQISPIPNKTVKENYGKNEIDFCLCKSFREELCVLFSQSPGRRILSERSNKGSAKKVILRGQKKVERGKVGDPMEITLEESVAAKTEIVQSLPCSRSREISRIRIQHLVSEQRFQTLSFRQLHAHDGALSSKH